MTGRAIDVVVEVATVVHDLAAAGLAEQRTAERAPLLAVGLVARDAGGRGLLARDTAVGAQCKQVGVGVALGAAQPREGPLATEQGAARAVAAAEHHLVRGLAHAGRVVHAGLLLQDAALDEHRRDLAVFLTQEDLLARLLS